MLLARASGRQREIGIRLAIGASRGRLMRQLLPESLVLSLAGAAAGTALAAALVRFVQAIPMPIPIPMALAFRIDGRVLLFTIAIATIAGLVAGLAPAFHATRAESDRGTEGGSPVVEDRQPTLDVARRAGGGPDRGHARAARRRGTADPQHSRGAAIDLGFRATGLAASSAEVGLVGYDEKRATRCSTGR